MSTKRSKAIVAISLGMMVISVAIGSLNGLPIYLTCIFWFFAGTFFGVGFTVAMRGDDVKGEVKT